MKNVMQCTLTMQGFWKGVLPSLVMVSNPSVNYMLYEYLRARLEDWRRVLSAADGTQLRRTSPAGASERRLVRVEMCKISAAPSHFLCLVSCSMQQRGWSLPALLQLLACMRT